MTFLTKIKFLLKKPKLVIITGKDRVSVKEVILHVLGQHFKLGRDVFIYDFDLSELSKMRFILNASSLKVLVVDHFGSVKSDFFSGATLISKSKKAVKIFSLDSKKEFSLEASDIKNKEDVNFKINYEGNMVPVWLNDTELDEEKIQTALVAAGVGLSLGLNLVEVSQALKTASRD